MKALKITKIALAVSYLFITNSFGQTESENLKKYWHYRDKFRKFFIKNGTEDGAGIPILQSEIITNNFINSINISHLPNGLYIAELRNAKGNKVLRQKLLV